MADTIFVVGFLAGVFGAIVIVVLAVTGSGNVAKEARNIIKSGKVRDRKRAERILKALDGPPNTRTRETDELYDSLKLLLGVKDSHV